MSSPPEAKRQKVAETAAINAQLPDSVVTDCSTLRAVLEREGLLPALLVRDTRAWELTSAADKIKLDLGAGGDAVAFDDITPNPTLATMRACGEAGRAAGCKSIVAFGGGTAIDTAKGAAWCLGGGGGTPAEKPAPGADAVLPLVAISTTAGTGSETTHFAVMWDGDKKFSLADPRLRPKIAVVDAWLHRGLPPAVTAATGLDALCQSLESIWSCGATAGSRAEATTGARLAMDHLETAVTAPTTESRTGMAAAAYFGGAAINATKTTTAHALSYALTADYNVPHGFAVALTFGCGNFDIVLESVFPSFLVVCIGGAPVGDGGSAALGAGVPARPYDFDLARQPVPHTVPHRAAPDLPAVIELALRLVSRGFVGPPPPQLRVLCST